MNFGSNDNTPVLLAPRPVRLTCAPYTFLSRAQPVRILSEPVKDSTDRSHSVGELKLFTEPSPDSSPRSSPRTGLPSEALEEFLSILKPSMFPPRSPARNYRQASMPSLHHERSFSFKGRARIDGVEEVENIRSEQSSRNTSLGSPTEAMDGEFQVLDMDDTPFRWFTANVLSSPISRTNTRNPFQRHATYPMTSNFTPLPMPLVSLSPAAIPLPLPTPDELAYA